MNIIAHYDYFFIEGITSLFLSVFVTDCLDKFEDRNGSISILNCIREYIWKEVLPLPWKENIGESKYSWSECF